jgi:hypothetical protein
MGAKGLRCRKYQVNIHRRRLGKAPPRIETEVKNDLFDVLVGVLLMLVEHATNANMGTGDPVHESKGKAHHHEFARTTDLPGPADCRIGFESEGAPPNLSYNPVGSDLAESP